MLQKWFKNFIANIKFQGCINPIHLDQHRHHIWIFVWYGCKCKGVKFKQGFRANKSINKVVAWIAQIVELDHQTYHGGVPVYIESMTASMIWYGTYSTGLPHRRQSCSTKAWLLYLQPISNNPHNNTYF